jgi:hypothetical protein
VLALAAAIAPSAAAGRPLAVYDVPKAVPQILKVWAAKYDGRVLTLDVEVPSAGELLLRIPTRCRTGAPAPCHRKTSVVRQASAREHLIIRRPMSVRMVSSGRLNLQARMEMPEGISISALRPKVHLVAGSAQG